MKCKSVFCSLVFGIFLCELTGQSIGLSNSNSDGKGSKDAVSRSKKLIEQVRRLTDSLPDRPGPEVKQEEWEIWKAEDDKLRKKRIGIIEELEKENLSDEQLKPYLEMKIDDIKTCFYYARLGEANKFEGKLYTMMEEGSPLSKTLATELFWSLNIYHVNTHEMTLSDADMQKIADFEISRKDQPEAGRLIAKAIKSGGFSLEAKSKWATWILENMPGESEGYESVAARNRLKAGFGKLFEFRTENVKGKVIDSESYKGKVVLLDFWAFWCGHCLAQMPYLKELNDDYYEKGLRIIGVFNDHHIDELKKYVKKNQISWPQLVDHTANKSSYMHPLAEEYNIKALPCYLLIGRDGKLRESGLRVELLKPAILKLLAQE